MECVKDVYAFLNDLNAALPGRVETELLSFLDSVQNHDWVVDLLLNQLANAKKKQDVKRY